MGTTIYYVTSLIRYWRKFINMIRNRSEWHLLEITQNELHDRINSDEPLVIFDIRPIQEFNGAKGHIPNARHIKIRELSSKLKDLQSDIYEFKDKEIVTICGGGGLSLIAVDIMVEADFINVKSLNGGMLEWYQNGYPTITTSESS